MTESCAAATLNPPGAPRFGTVGRALPDSEVMVSADREILMRGPHVFAGYHQQPERPPRRSSATAGCTAATSASSRATGI